MRRSLVGPVLVAVGLISWCFPAAADNSVGARVLGFKPPPELVGDWKESGTYDLKSAGIRIHAKPGQHVLILGERPPEIYGRCRNHVQAVVHDPKLGLMLIGRWNPGRPIIDDWDARSTAMFAEMIKSYRTFDKGGWTRLPLKEADFYSPPTYDSESHRARWSFYFAKDEIDWFSTYWFTFDRDGYVVVALLSRGPGLDGLDAAFNVSMTAPIEVQNLEQHPAPLPPPGDPADYTAAFMAIMAEPMIGACQFQTPFGDSY